MTDIFKFDPNYLENEEKYKAIKAEILGEDSEEEGSESESDQESEGEDEGALRAIVCKIDVDFWS